MEEQDNQYQAPQNSQPQAPQQPQANPYQQPQANPYQQQYQAQQPQANPYQQQYQAQQPQANPYQQPQQANPYQQQYQAQQPQANPYQQPGQYNPYQAPQGYAQPPVPHQSNGLAITGMVLGIVSCALCWAWYLGLPAGIAGLILSIIAKKKGPNKMATAGLICSIIGLAVSTIVMIVWIVALASLSSYGYWY